MKSACPKQYLRIADQYVIDYALSALRQSSSIRSIIVSLNADDIYWQKTQSSKDSKVTVCKGGAQRMESVWNALLHLRTDAAPDDRVLIHDASRPCLSMQDLDKLLAAGDNSVGNILAVPVADALKRADENLHACESVKRQDLWSALTPQMFQYELIYNVLEDLINKKYQVEDEAEAMLMSGYSVHLVEGERSNIKLTYPSDLALAEAYLLQHAEVFT